VDLKKGRVLLSAAARQVLDVRTVEVRSGRHERGLRAYSTIVAACQARWWLCPSDPAMW
jgi:hypothetical protein